MTAPVRQRTRFGLLIAACIFIAVGIGVALGAQRLISNAALMSHTHEVIATVDAMEARLRDAEATQRGYLLTGDPAYLADYRNASAALPGIRDHLFALLADNPPQQARAQLLWASIDKRLGQTARTLDRYREGGLPAAQAVITQEAILSSTAIRREAAALDSGERELLVQRDESTQDSANLLRALALLGIPIGILVILAVYRLLVLEIRRRAHAEEETAQANEQLQVALDHAQLRSVELRALSNYGNMLQSCATVDEAWPLTTGLLASLLPEIAGTVYRIRNSQDHAELVLQWGGASESAAMMAVDACWALRRGQPHVSDATHGGRCVHLSAVNDPHPAGMCLPLVAQGAQLGLLSLSGDPQALAEHRDIIEAAAEKLSMALANLSLQDRLRQQSIRDPLSGLFNRRYLEESATRELARCARRGLPLSVLMLDIDHFKAFNDAHGHSGGDAVLAQFGKLLQTMTRGEDIACRYGGEEFTLILPEADLDAASARAEAIRLAVEAMQVPYLGKLLPQVTVSIGVAGYPAHGRTPEALMQSADKALYQAKRAGRNRIDIAVGM
ncbi:MAG: diguanylate cyclase [Thermomonas sp.]